jgi:glycosyltransferase involved in cell wall biosynthesis
MTIAFDAKRYFNNATGLGFYSRTLLDGLRCFYPQNRYLLYTPYNHGGIVPDEPDMRLPDTWHGRTFHQVWRSSGITGQLRREGVEIFHGLSHEVPRGLRQAGIRSVVSVHDLIFMRYPKLYPFLDRVFYEKKYRRSAEEADVVVAISQQTREDLCTFFDIAPQKVRVIGQSCDPLFGQLSLSRMSERTALPSPLLPEFPALDFVVAVGSLSPRKNWHNLLYALALLKAESGIELPLAAVGTGSGAYPERLKQQAARLGLRVCWAGYLPTEQLAALYRRAAMLVYPSVFEGFGIPILEAMSVGIPVVTTLGGCFEEVGGEAALYAPPDSPAAMAEQIERALESGQKARMAAARPAQLARFSAETICAKWMEGYRNWFD